MSGVFTHLRTRPRLFIAAAVGIVAALAAPGIEHVVTRSLLGWNVGVWLYLVLAGTLLQSVLSFVFNTAILAFTVNIAASLF